MRKQKGLLTLSVLLSKPHGGDTADELMANMDKAALGKLFNEGQKGLDNMLSILEREKIRVDLMNPDPEKTYVRMNHAIVRRLILFYLCHGAWVASDRTSDASPTRCRPGPAPAMISSSLLTANCFERCCLKRS
jgi:hypothetical protein